MAVIGYKILSSLTSERDKAMNELVIFLGHLTSWNISLISISMNENPIVFVESNIPPDQIVHLNLEEM